MYTADNGHKEVMEQLLATNQADPEAEDNIGITALIYATAHNHAQVVSFRLILQRKGPSYAAEFGHEEVVRILFEAEEMVPNLPDVDYESSSVASRRTL
ncbi:hypothetical protein NW769_004831 [Fusarium oxysporum]|nr:hypothetical protein NW769_004831 [Fusarium oxysporum]